MKQFAKFIFASCLGTFLALLVLGLIGIGSITKMASQEEKVEVKPNSVLKLTLGKAIPEKTNNIAPSGNTFEFGKKTLGLHDMLRALSAAKDDDDIKGIYLEIKEPVSNMATMTTLREGINDFKESGKFVLAYNTYYSQNAYYMASVADKVYVNPMGGIEFNGFSAQIPFFKDMIDRLGIKAQVMYAGKFKSATEPFRRKDMSPENREQVRVYLDELYGVFLEGISESRGVSVAELKAIANEYKIREAKDAVEYKLADGLKYKDEVLAELRERLGLEAKDKINQISLADYKKAAVKKNDFKHKDKIAVVYAEGGIVDGKGETGNIGGDKYASIIRKIRKDDKVKAIVLRVNSGGGSGLASEIIWRELVLAKEQGIKVVVSMGDLAASGGYYIACEGDKIFAEPNTLTGSIGVFGLIPSLDDFLDEEIGITFDTVKTGEYATFGTPVYDLTEGERAIYQNYIDSFYVKFKRRVANGRDITMEQVEEVAQGRVWTGLRAKELGLVDELGGLEDAMAYASELAGIEKYRRVEYPKVKDKFEEILEEITGKKPAEALIKSQLGEFYPYYRQAKEIKNMQGVQARMPYTINIVSRKNIMAGN